MMDDDDVEQIRLLLLLIACFGGIALVCVLGVWLRMMLKVWL